MTGVQTCALPIYTATDPGSACPDGAACDDGDPCTYGETCLDEACQGGTAYSCDDARDCTKDSCDGAGHCRYELLPDTCLIRGICRAANQADPENACQACRPGMSVDRWSAANETASCDPSGGLDACQVATEGTCQAGVCVPVDPAARDCDDHNPCTTDGCSPLAGCTHVPFSGGTCLQAGNACTPGTCDQGVCVEPPGVSCDDGNPCTADTCDPATGCHHETLDAVVCSDGDACTDNDTCVAGNCTGRGVNCSDGNICTLDGCHPVTGCFHDLEDNTCCQNGVSICNDDNPCTDDGCDPVTLACLNVPNAAACSDDDPCTVGDQCGGGQCQPGADTLSCNDGNACTDDACVPGEGCTHAPNDATCDDRNACTLGDHCSAGTCVAGTGTPTCADGNPCTDDFCFPSSGCAFLANVAACDDGDPCTVNDRCKDTACAGRAMNCNDANECTADSCVDGTCQYLPLTGTGCSDGLACTTTDHCEAGACVADLAECACKPTFSPDITKLTSLQVPATGYPGDGLDLDHDAATCAPAVDCSDGIDNCLGPVASMGNSSLADTVAGGDLILLLQHENLRLDGTPYGLSVLIGKGLDPANATCDFQAATCDYIVNASSLDLDTCLPVGGFTNARILGGRLTAGGQGSTFPFDMTISGGIALHVDLHMATIDAAVTVGGGTLTALDGFLGGAVPKQQIKDAILALPDTVELPMTKEDLIGLLDLLVVPDMDIDGDGVYESASLSIRVAGIPGHVTGIE